MRTASANKTTVTCETPLTLTWFSVFVRTGFQPQSDQVYPVLAIAHIINIIINIIIIYRQAESVGTFRQYFEGISLYVGKKVQEVHKIRQYTTKSLLLQRQQLATPMGRPCQFRGRGVTRQKMPDNLTTVIIINVSTPLLYVRVLSV